MYVYFVDGYKPDWITVAQAPYIERDLEVHQVMEWEYQVTRKYRIENVRWNKPYLALDGTDAIFIDQTPVTIFTDRPAGYIEFDVEEVMNNWKCGDPNHGLIVRATNEGQAGRELRFYSREISENYRRPIIKVLCIWNTEQKLYK